MNNIIKTLKQKNMATGYLYFYIHFVTEVACFYFLNKITSGSYIVWIIPFIYDALAFVPQGLIGYISDKFPKINVPIIGTFLLAIAYFIFMINPKYKILEVVILCIGNCCMHIAGAETTLRTSNGKLSHSAIFVSGGSFGVITGKLLSTTFVPSFAIVILIFTMIPYIILAKTYVNKEDEESYKCKNFNYYNKKLPLFLIIILATFVVIIRGYMGYGIPTSWNKTVIQNILFFVIMGIGKALGGIISDSFGIRKTVIISTILAIPFLCFGNNYMLISIIGVMFFSMTMAITLGILVSTLKNTPGLAFGFTTIGLFLGTAPIFFIKLTNQLINISFITCASILCCLILLFIIGKEEKEDGTNI